MNTCEELQANRLDGCVLSALAWDAVRCTNTYVIKQIINKMSG